jgi:hypothetical protein
MKKEIPVNKKVGRNILPTIRARKAPFFVGINLFVNGNNW